VKQDLWGSMLDADMNARYWKKVARIYSTIDTWIKIVLAICASGTVASWKLWEATPVAWKTLSAISAVVSIILPIIQLSKSINKISSLAGKWLQIKTDYELLWVDCKNDEPPKDLSKRYKEIKNREVTVKKTETDLPEYNYLIKKAFNEVKVARGLA